MALGSLLGRHERFGRKSLSKELMTTFTALLLSLPAGTSTTRMRLWRALKSTGCGVLRDGVYILPAGSPQVATLAGIESEVKSAEGSAIVVELRIKPSQLPQVQALFDRSDDYGVLVARLNSARSALRRLGKRRGESTVQRLRRAFDELSAIDFYPGHARSQALDAMSALETKVRELSDASEPRALRTRVRKLDAARYRGRAWATRKDPWIDRLASAWLIKRFIDEQARFVWIDRPSECPKRALGFDFDGAQFTHTGERVTFEVLLASFGLDRDLALCSIGAVVHFLDVGGIPVPDAKGLEAVISGIREKTRSDDARLRDAMRVLDFLYAGYVNRSASATGLA